MAIAPPPPTDAGPSQLPPQLPKGYEIRKKGHKLRNFVIGMAAIVLVAVVATNASKGNDGTKVGSGGGSTGTSQSATPSKFAVGDTIKVGDNVLFSVTSVRDNVASGNQFETPKNGQFLVAGVSLQNKGSRPTTISSLISFELRDENGQSYTETILSSAPKPPDGEIAAGDKLAGGLSYDVPKGHSYKLYFKNDLFSGGQVIIDLGAH